MILNETAKIAIGEDNVDHLVLLERAIERLGHQIVARAQTGSALIEACGIQDPDVVITDIVMPDMDGLTASSQIYAVRPVPVIVITSQLDDAFIDRAMEEHVLGFLRKPVDAEDLKPAIAIARQRFTELEALKTENSTLQKALEDRKIIERAKGVLMKQASLSEEEAFRRLQKLARDKRTKLSEIAAMIITAAEAME